MKDKKKITPPPPGDKELIITDYACIKDIQQAFQDEFPFLKIEFFKKPLDSNVTARKSHPLSGKNLLKDVRGVHSDGALSINGNRKVSEIEGDFRDNFGLYVQVFRKLGSMWIETTLTDHWPLYRQNHAGEQMS